MNTARAEQEIAHATHAAATAIIVLMSASDALRHGAVDAAWQLGTARANAQAAIEHIQLALREEER